MNKKDTKNEYIGIISIIVIVIVAVIAIFYFSRQTPGGPRDISNAAISLETHSSYNGQSS